MILLFTIVILLSVFALVLRNLQHSPHPKRRQGYWRLAIASTLIILLLLVITGRIHWLGALVGLVLPLGKMAFHLIAERIMRNQLDAKQSRSDQAASDQATSNQAASDQFAANRSSADHQSSSTRDKTAQYSPDDASVVAIQLPLSAAEARAILGVNESASRADIEQAYQTLLAKLHPDQGGNEYLTLQLTRARDCLLGA